MEISDQGIIVDYRKFSEKDAFIKIFSSQNGVYSGILKNSQSKSNRSNIQIGNMVNFNWYARLSEHLGNFKIELIKPFSASYMNSKIKLTAIHSACALVNHCLPDRFSEQALYLFFVDFFNYLSSQKWIEKYIVLEIKLLSELGFGLELDKCVVTGSSDNLIYLSPKSGKAVCRESGDEYRDKLFLLPNFLVDHSVIPRSEDINLCLKITGYFIAKYILKSKNLDLPTPRIRLAQIHQKIIEQT